MTDNPYGPDKPCRRTRCCGTDPAVGTGHANHLGGAHLDPRDREHYDGLRVQAMPAPIRGAARTLMQHVNAYNRPAPDDTELRVAVDVALDAAFQEIDRLRQQVAHVRVDADRKVREASRASLDCEHHGEVIRSAEAQAGHFAADRDRVEKARLALLGEHQAIRDALSKGGTIIPSALRALNEKASRAHERAFSPLARKSGSGTKK